MNQKIIERDDLIGSFAQHRQVLLKHTADALRIDPAMTPAEREEREAKLSAILVSSLEQLKVAEEELIERTTALANLRDELAERLVTEHQLFDLAPVCLLSTDIYGNIIEANRACLQLLRSEQAAVAREPLTRFIPADERRGFRESLARIVAAEGVRDYRFMLIRPTDSPLWVSATVRVIDCASTASGQRLLWSIRVIDESGQQPEA